jgi:hypothetical protein
LGFHGKWYTGRAKPAQLLAEKIIVPWEYPHLILNLLDEVTILMATVILLVVQVSIIFIPKLNEGTLIVLCMD